MKFRPLNLNLVPIEYSLEGIPLFDSKYVQEAVQAFEIVTPEKRRVQYLAEVCNMGIDVAPMNYASVGWRKVG